MTASDEMNHAGDTARGEHDSSRGESRPTVLLVEDDRAIRRYLEVVLGRAGYGVITVGDGLEGMRAALGAPIAAIITDAVLPHLSGYELCRFVRRHPQLARLPVIMMSGLASSEPAGEECADAFLPKPVSPEQLTECLARLLARREGAAG